MAGPAVLLDVDLNLDFRFRFLCDSLRLFHVKKLEKAVSFSILVLLISRE